MAVILRRIRRPRRRWSAPALAVICVLGLMLGGCGFNVQTNLPYTPADGVSLDVGQVHVRNLMILSKAAGEGFLSASLVSSQPDALVSASGKVIKPDGSDGGDLTFSFPAPVTVNQNVAVVLTDQPTFVTVKGDGLIPGTTANLTLQFKTAGEATLQVPVVDANHPAYVTVSPSPSGSPSS